MKNEKLGIYIHIPFCVKKCPYCDFYSLSSIGGQMDAYLKALCDEIKSLKRVKDFADETLKEREVDTIYFGGGTPSAFGGARLAKIIKTIKEEFNVTRDAEISVECNPSSSSLELFDSLVACGANRISLGLQSASLSERQKLGRTGSAETAKRAVEWAKSAGIGNISLDLMIGIPDSNTESLKNSVDFCLDLDIPHISAYMLKIEENTPFAKNIDKLNLPDEDEVCQMYYFLCDYLNDKGLLQYEISNFAKPLYESRHNLKYWNSDQYLGLGPSAHSFISKKRFYFDGDIKGFISAKPASFDSFGGSFEEYAMLRLRLAEGLDEKKVQERFAINIPQSIYTKAEVFEENGLLETDERGLRLSKEGFLISNLIIASLLEK